jgi:glycyl-tRNA synthetase beta subunit
MEELPDNVIVPSIENMKTSLEKCWSRRIWNMARSKLRPAQTPRAICNRLAEKQNDVESVKLGPSVNIALIQERTYQSG